MTSRGAPDSEVVAGGSARVPRPRCVRLSARAAAQLLPTSAISGGYRAWRDRATPRQSLPKQARVHSRRKLLRFIKSYLNAQNIK